MMKGRAKMNTTTFLGLLNEHPALGITGCVTVSLLGLFGYLSVRRVCDALTGRGGKVRRTKQEQPEQPETQEAPKTVKAPPAKDGKATELRQALTGLGYKGAEIEHVMDKLEGLLPHTELPQLIRRALVELPNRARVS